MKSTFDSRTLAIDMRPPQEKMHEPEVALRLTLYFVRAFQISRDVTVSIDGAAVKEARKSGFDTSEFLVSEGWSRPASASYQGDWGHPQREVRIVVTSRPGIGDITLRLKEGPRVVVETKGGPLVQKKGSVEYPKLREALGQLLTFEPLEPHDIMAVAVPSSEKFEELCQRWRKAPLVQRAGISLLTVGTNGVVRGIPEAMTEFYATDERPPRQ